MGYRMVQGLCAALLGMAAIGHFNVAAAADSASSPARLLHNVSIYTGDPAKPASAMVWRNGRILALGSLGELEKAHPAARQIDGNGRHVLPGLIDAHGHLTGLGSSLLDARLAGAESVEEIVSRLQAHEKELPAGSWLLGQGWDQNRWPNKRFPAAADLDGAFPDRPVWLRRIDGHAAWGNSAALRALSPAQRAKLDDADWQPDGGQVLRVDGKASGVFIDRAMAFVNSVVPPTPQAELDRALRLALAEAVKQGLTGVHNMRVSADDMTRLRTFADRGELPLRVTAYADGDQAALAGLCAFGRYEHAGGRLKMRGVKLYADGALGSRGAALLADYSDEKGNRGILVTSEEALRAAMVKARDCGIQVATHGIGDRGNRIILDLYQQVLGSQATSDHRWRDEHSQVVALEDIPRFAKLGVMASMQPTHATSDMPWAGVRVGAERLQGAYAWRRFLDAGIALPLGSDFPVEEVNPMLGLYAAVTRQNLDGQPPGGWLPDQLLTRVEALDGFTKTAARAGFAEDEVGELAVGKRADFIMLDDDYFTVSDRRIADLSVHSTWVDGVPVYQRDDSESGEAPVW